MIDTITYVISLSQYIRSFKTAKQKHGTLTKELEEAEGESAPPDTGVTTGETAGNYPVPAGATCIYQCKNVDSIYRLVLTRHIYPFTRLLNTVLFTILCFNVLLTAHS